MKYLRKYESFDSLTFKEIIGQVFVDLIDQGLTFNIRENLKLVNIFEYTSVDSIKRKKSLDLGLKAINDKNLYNGNIVVLNDSRQNSNSGNFSDDIVSIIETANDYLKSKGYEFITMEANKKYYKDVCNLQLEDQRIILYYVVAK